VVAKAGIENSNCETAHEKYKRQYIGESWHTRSLILRYLNTQPAFLSQQLGTDLTIINQEARILMSFKYSGASTALVSLLSLPPSYMGKARLRMGVECTTLSVILIDWMKPYGRRRRFGLTCFGT
jgi:hypothetical protein